MSAANLSSNATALTPGDYISAVFGLDFLAAPYSFESVARIHNGEVDDWVNAIARSGLFSNRVVADAAFAWEANPRLILMALLADADEMTHKRFEMVWDSLGRVDAVAYA
ncbi:hypothetical protein [Rhodococcus sp. NPDC058521]|uniref:hypothetical protein n=1 Tax=Rhodococcus sp. NPDC058521 TaxID=3346536 RepID=UPI0036510CF1